LLQKLQRAARLWDVLEQTLLGILILGMVVLSSLQIVLRNFFGTGIPWIDPVLGASVLWITMFGALAATGACKHIKIDLVSHLVPERPRAYITALTNVFAAVVCGVLVYAGFRYVVFQREMDDIMFLRVPSWTVYTVMPAGFLLVAARFLLQALVALITPVASREEGTQSEQETQ